MTIDFDAREREGVVRDLESGDEEVRRLAVERVGALLLDQAIPYLIERLGDPSWRVRKSAVERLVACPDAAAAVEALIVALGDGENSGRRNAAVESLVQTGARAVPRLIEATESSDPDVRKLVADTLAGICDERATAPLIGLLEDPDPNVRAAAADALGAIGGEGVVPALRRVVVQSGEDRLVRFSSLHALAALETPVRAREIASVLDDPVLRPAALALLGRIDEDEGVAALLKGLESDSRATREAAMRSLLRLIFRVDGAREERLVGEIRRAALASPALVAGAIERLGEADLSTRLVLVQFLGLLRVEAAVVPILLAGRDEALAQVALSTLESLGPLAEEAIDAAWPRLDADTRRNACRLFGHTDGERGASRLLASLECPNPEQRVEAARSIGRRGLVAGLAPLVHRLIAASAETEIDSEEEVDALTEALISLADPASDRGSALTEQAIELLASQLGSAVESVRLAIAQVLGCVGRPQDTQLVAFLLKDPDASVRRAAVDALARLEPGTAAEPLRLALADESAPVRIAAARALGASKSDEVFDDLRRLAGDEDPRVRAAAVHAVARRFVSSDEGARRSAALAVVDTAFTDEAPVALAAVEALFQVGGSHAARAAVLLERPEPELVRQAVRCVGVHGDVEMVLPLISHPDWSVRAEAIQTLGDRGVAKAVPPILRRLEIEQDEFVRGAILQALTRLEG